MIRKVIFGILVTLFLHTGIVYAGSTGSEDLSKKVSSASAGECFEGLSRGIFKFNHRKDVPAVLWDFNGNLPRRA